MKAVLNLFGFESVVHIPKQTPSIKKLLRVGGELKAALQSNNKEGVGVTMTESIFSYIVLNFNFKEKKGKTLYYYYDEEYRTDYN